MSRKGRQKKFMYLYRDEVKKMLAEKGVELPYDASIHVDFAQNDPDSPNGIDITVRVTSKSDGISEETYTRINELVAANLSRITRNLLNQYK